MRRACVCALLLLSVRESRPTPVRMECCDVWFALNRYIQTHAGVDRSKCVPRDCVGTGQVESFLSETNAVLPSRMRVEGTALVLDLSNSSALQDILVWSYLGRHFTSTRQQRVQDDLYFEFNIATRSMTLRKVQCEFQKQVYETVIVLVIVVLIFVLSSRMLRTVLDEYRAAHAAVAPAPAVHLASVLPHSAALSMRYRAIPPF